MRLVLKENNFYVRLLKKNLEVSVFHSNDENINCLHSNIK